MKTSFWFITLIISFSISLHCQEINKKVIDEKHEQEILIGYCNRAGLQEGDFGEIFASEYEYYEADVAIIEQLSNYQGSIDIVLVLGTWCHDSQEQVPRFYRVLDDAVLSDERVTIICVDGNKTGGDLSIEHLGIEFVPTFIFYDGGEEIGRIIETPEVSIEADMWEIIK